MTKINHFIQKKFVFAALVILLTTVIAFAFHVFLQIKGDAYVAEKVKEMGIELSSNKEMTNNPYFVIVASSTALITTLISYLLLTALWNVIPGQTWWQKGFFYSCLLLVLKGQLIRTPLVGLAAGIPPWVIGISQLDIWVPGFVLGMGLAFGFHMYRTTSASSPP